MVHGIPNKNTLKEGDVISIDCGVYKNGFYGDHAYTFAVGDISNKIEALLKTTKESLYIGIECFKEGNRVGDLGYSIQSHCEKNGYSVVRELVCHGIGKNMHEGPEIPNYGKRGTGKSWLLKRLLRKRFSDDFGTIFVALGEAKMIKSVGGFARIQFSAFAT